MLAFTNPGEIDPRMAQLFGVNVKGSDNSIGHFGTGLKYAIASTLRYGGTVEMWSGLSRFRFTTEPTILRGKSFDLVVMIGPEGDRTTMPFTLELGKEWLPWMTYREFWANCLDEGGQVFDCYMDPRAGETTINVECSQLNDAHEKSSEFILQSTPLATVQFDKTLVEIHQCFNNSTVFYKGIKVHTLPQGGVYTYNILSHIKLTEDRSIYDWWTVSRNLLRAVGAAPKKLLEPLFLSGDKFWEWCSEWNIYYSASPEGFRETIIDLAKKHRLRLPPGLVSTFVGDELPPAIQMSTVQKKMLSKAILFCETQLQTPIVNNIVVVESIGAGGLGMVVDGQIYLATEAFRQGTKRLAGTILEEQLHITHSLRDYSSQMQFHLVDLVCSLGEQIMGEPL